MKYSSVGYAGSGVTQGCIHKADPVLVSGRSSRGAHCKFDGGTSFERVRASKAERIAYAGCPITVLIGTPVGARMDIIGRTAVDQAVKKFGRPVENCPGGGGLVATNAVMQAASDGYMLLIGAVATVLRPLLDPTATYDPQTALR